MCVSALRWRVVERAKGWGKGCVTRVIGEGWLGRGGREVWQRGRRGGEWVVGKRGERPRIWCFCVRRVPGISMPATFRRDRCRTKAFLFLFLLLFLPSSSPRLSLSLSLLSPKAEAVWDSSRAWTAAFHASDLLDSVPGIAAVSVVRSCTDLHRLAGKPRRISIRCASFTMKGKEGRISEEISLKDWEERVLILKIFSCRKACNNVERGGKIKWFCFSFFFFEREKKRDGTCAISHPRDRKFF